MTILSFQNLLLLAIMASFLVTVSAFRGFSSVTKRSSFQIDSSLPSKEHEIVPRYIGNTQKSALFSTGFDKEPSSGGNFEYFELLELKIQANAIVEQQVTTARLAIEKRKELEGYCRKIVNRRESAIPLNKLDEYLPDSKWQLAFTTQNLSIESLPKDAIIKLEFGNENKMNYILEFTKTFGLNRLVAKSRYNVDVSTNYCHYYFCFRFLVTQ